MFCSNSIDKLIAKGEAQYGEYVTTGGLSVLPIPDSKAIIITSVKLKAFTDLPDGSDFLDPVEVANFSFHQLRIFGKKGRAVYKARHDLAIVRNNVGPVPFFYSLPTGYHDWRVWLPHEEYVIFELTHINQPFTDWSTVSDRLSAAVNNPPPPSGYGTAPAGLVSTLYFRNLIEGNEVRPYNSFAAPSAGVLSSFTQFEWPVSATSRLNEPLTAIDFGVYTVPYLQVGYVLYNKISDATFSGNV